VMRIALGQVNVVVGDLRGNAERIVDVLRRAADAGADLALLPELAVTGYPPEDLLAREHFVDENLTVLAEIARSAPVRAVVGFVDREDGVLYNAAALIEGGQVTRVYHKRRLPNYGVFDERRYFEAGPAAEIDVVAGERVALTICEDIWVPEPAAEAAALGANVLLNISASPYHAGKGLARERMLRDRARENGVWLAYVNLVGGQDELVFDGRSAVIAPDGTVVARAASFAEDLLVADVGAGAPVEVGSQLTPHPEPDEEIYSALVLGLGDYLRKNGFSDVVLGLSGGIDSALVAAIATDALGPDHVHGVLMPSRYSSAGSVADAETLAGALGIETLTLPIECAVAAYEEMLLAPFAGRAPDVTEENLQARIRGTLLMALSNKFGWLTLATGNKSELSVGYSTLYGDMVGGFAPIKDVFKTRVYALARWRNARDAGTGPIPESTLTKPPSAELRPGQVDQDSLPPYDVLDSVLEHYVESDQSRELIVRAGFDEATVDRVIRMTDAAEYKRRQGPLGVKITPKAFGKDRRMPVTNRYRG